MGIFISGNIGNADLSLILFDDFSDSAILGNIANVIKNNKKSKPPMKKKGSSKPLKVYR